MTRIWLVVNPASGSYDASVPARLAEAARQSGAELVGTTIFPDAPLPDAAALTAERIDILAVHTGDGTINAAMHAAAGNAAMHAAAGNAAMPAAAGPTTMHAAADWTGALLALPGGTMNLLARHLHDARDPAAILLAALDPAATARHVTMVAGVDADCTIDGLVGVFAGPTTAWGDVRETLRRYDFAGLVEAVPRAIEQTFSGAPVRLAGSTEDFPAIYIEPRNGHLRLMGFTADDAAALFEHGFAWLGGDFRDGPHEPLGEVDEVEIVSSAEIGLLVDGERGHTHAPLRLRAVPSPVRFIVTRAEAMVVHPL